MVESDPVSGRACRVVLTRGPRVRCGTHLTSRRLFSSRTSYPLSFPLALGFFFSLLEVRARVKHDRDRERTVVWGRRRDQHDTAEKHASRGPSFGTGEGERKNGCVTLRAAPPATAAFLLLLTSRLSPSLRAEARTTSAAPPRVPFLADDLLATMVFTTALGAIALRAPRDSMV